MRSPGRSPASVSRRRWPRWVAALAAALLAACAALTPPGRPLRRPGATATRTPWSVTASSLNLRRCPGVTCGRIGVLRQGDVVLRLREDGEWVEVRVVRTGQAGWVASRFLEEQAEAGPEGPTAPGPSAPGSPAPRASSPGGPVKEEFLE